MDLTRFLPTSPNEFLKAPPIPFLFWALNSLALSFVLFYFILFLNIPKTKFDLPFFF